jgi:hypothetical protein
MKETRMNTTELDTRDEIRKISEEDLGAATGGLQVYTGGGGGKVVGSGHGGSIDPVLTALSFAGGFAVVAICIF